GCTGFRYNCAVVLRHLHKYQLALVQIDESLAREPQNPLFRDQKATILSQMGRFAEALACRRRLVEEFPGSAKVWLQFGHTLRDEGYQAECLAAFHKALQIDPSMTAVYASLAALKV